MRSKYIKIVSRIELDSLYDEAGIRNLLEPYAAWCYGVCAASQGIATLIPAMTHLPDGFVADPSLVAKIYPRKLTKNSSSDMERIIDYLSVYIRHVYLDQSKTHLSIGNIPGDNGRSYEIVSSIASYFFVQSSMDHFILDYMVNEKYDYRSRRRFGVRSESGVSYRDGWMRCDEVPELQTA